MAGIVVVIQQKQSSQATWIDDSDIIHRFWILKNIRFRVQIEFITSIQIAL